MSRGRTVAGLVVAGLVVAVVVAGSAAASEAGAPADATPATLYVALDCVPYAVVADLVAEQGGGHFAGWSGPSVLVSSFPSTTSVAMGGLLAPLGIAASPGYEARFFDWQKGRVRGGGLFSYFRIGFPWRTFFDWRKRGPVASAFASLRPLEAAQRGLEKALDAFVEFRGETYLVYIGDTDSAAHLRGPDSLSPVFLTLERLLRRATRRRPDRPFRTVLFSDHGVAGGEPLVNLWRPLRRRLEGAGWRVRKRLEGPRDVALTPFGLVSSFELYVLPGGEEALSADVTAVDGVELCARRGDGDDELVVVGRRGRARVRRGVGAAGEVVWSYHTELGDPLGYGPVAQRLARAQGSPADGPFSDRAWFDATWDQRFPDAFHRLARAFDLVANPASVVCSAAPGAMFGARGTELAARLATGRLRWTHGALHAQASDGFLLTDDPRWRPRPAVRFDRALAPFAAAEPRRDLSPSAPGSFRAGGQNR